MKIFTSKLIRSQIPIEELAVLVKQFREHKETRSHKSIFGRDVPYDFPSSVKMAGLRHIHLADTKSGPFKIHIVDFHRTSDTALVYCQGFYNPNIYLLIGIITNAHVLYVERRQSWFVHYVEIAEGFRNKY